MDKKFWIASFTLAGTIIGAGILGLPYVFAKSGFLTGLFWLLILGGAITFANLCLGEVSLRTGGENHLIGYAEKYLGLTGKRLMFFAIIFNIYAALLAYIIAEGQSFSKLLFGTFDYSLYFAIGFWLIMIFFLGKGLKSLKQIETWGVLAIILIIFIISIIYAPQIKIENLFHFSDSVPDFILPFGVVLFSLLGFSVIPELKMELKGEEKKLKKAIIFGGLISVSVYFIFCLIFVGFLGHSINEVATLSMNKFVIVFGIFTVLTSYFALSFALKDTLELDLKCSKKMSFILVSIIPLLLYFSVYFFKMASFVNVLGITGVISGGLMEILILFLAMKAKKKGNRKPEYEIPLNWFIIIILSLIFLAGIIFELFF